MIGIQQSSVIGNELAIAWSDGSETYLGLEALRKACPCASCQGEPDATPSHDKKSGPRRDRIKC